MKSAINATASDDSITNQADNPEQNRTNEELLTIDNLIYIYLHEKKSSFSQLGLINTDQDLSDTLYSTQARKGYPSFRQKLKDDYSTKLYKLINDLIDAPLVHKDLDQNPLIRLRKWHENCKQMGLQIDNAIDYIKAFITHIALETVERQEDNKKPKETLSEMCRKAWKWYSDFKILLSQEDREQPSEEAYKLVLEKFSHSEGESSDATERKLYTIHLEEAKRFHEIIRIDTDRLFEVPPSIRVELYKNPAFFDGLLDYITLDELVAISHSIHEHQNNHAKWLCDENPLPYYYLINYQIITINEYLNALANETNDKFTTSKNLVMDYFSQNYSSFIRIFAALKKEAPTDTDLSEKVFNKISEATNIEQLVEIV